ncbi:MAG: hypothetical protein KME47_09390 [Nodosilinea sp. WJT8-NPBG4]|nr:hypothetical protein [Nodosilinea sp. WJT8-NPBG4]
MASFASGAIQLKNVFLNLKLLPPGSRTVTPVTLTVETAALAGATTLELDASAGTIELLPGQALTFSDLTVNKRRVQVIVTEEASIVSGTPVEVAVAPIIFPLAANLTASFIPGMLPLFGITDHSFAQSDTDVDSTSAESGSGTEVEKIRAARTISVSGIERPRDRALTEIVYRAGQTTQFFGSEVFFLLSYPDGSEDRGVAKIGNLNRPGNMNEIKKYSFELSVQGDTYEYIPAYSFT